MDELYDQIMALTITASELRPSVTPEQREALNRFIEALDTAYQDHLAEVMDEALDDVPDYAEEDEE
jgi:uncharacterized protein (DUF2342 family)